jgi:hypothetical protein
VPDLACHHHGNDEIGDSGELLELIQVGRPAWMRDALCAERPDVNFFPEGDESTLEAVRTCVECLCRHECLLWALEQPVALAGIWGGTDEADRQRLRAGQPRRYRRGPLLAWRPALLRETTEDGRILPRRAQHR